MPLPELAQPATEASAGVRQARGSEDDDRDDEDVDRAGSDG